MKKNYKFLILGIIFIMLLISSYLIYYNYFVFLEVKKLPISVEVVNYSIIGINLDTNGIYFDKIMQGSVGKRAINIDNKYNFDVFVIIKVEGNISPMIRVSENDFILKSNETKSIIYYCDTKGSDYGNYNGFTKVIFKRA